MDVASALRSLTSISISLHCWQGEDVGGFEKTGTGLGGGLAVTGSYPGKARTPDELRADVDKALSLIPGRHRVNLHACDRDEVAPEHFCELGWVGEATPPGQCARSRRVS